MKRLFLILLAVTLVCIPVKLWADAEFTSTVTPKAATLDYVSGGGVAVTDAANGYTQRVDDTGAAYVKQKAQAIYGINASNGLYAGVAAVASACRVSTITFGGPTSAVGDYLLVYDAASVTGTPKFDVSVAVAQDTKQLVIPGGAVFATGVFLKSGTSTSIASITYEN